MKRFFTSCVATLFLILSVTASAQIHTEKGAASDATLNKIAKLDLLIKLVPLAIQKEQYPVILDGLERAKDILKKELEREDDAIALMDASVTEAVSNAVEKGIYPPHEIQDSVDKQIKEIRNKKLGANYQMIKLVYSALQSKFNAGQMKVMAESFAASFINPDAKPGTLTDDVKINFFIDRVFLDPLTMDLLTEMSKHAS